MKKILSTLLLLLPFIVLAQTNGTLQKTTATGVVRGSFGSSGIDTIPLVQSITTFSNGQTMIWNSTLKKFQSYTLPSIPAGLSDSLLNKANRNFNNVAAGAIANVKLANSTISGISLGSNLAELTNGYGLSAGGTYNGGTARTFAVDTTAIRTVANSVSLAGLQTRLNSYVLTSRTLTAGYGLAGGGDLSANRAFVVDTASAIGSKGWVNGRLLSYAPVSGSGNYIRNGTSLQTASYNISGSGRLGDSLAVDAGSTDPLVLTKSAFSSGVYGLLKFGRSGNLATLVGIWGRQALGGMVYSAQSSFGHSFRLDNNDAFMIGSTIESYNPFKAPSLRLTGVTSGTAGTDSILVKKSGDNIVYKIPANYYATSASSPFNVSGITISPTTANNILSVSSNTANPSIYGFTSNASGIGVHGQSSSNGATGVKGTAGGSSSIAGWFVNSGTGKAGLFSNASNTDATVTIQNTGSANIVNFSNTGGTAAYVNINGDIVGRHLTAIGDITAGSTVTVGDLAGTGNRIVTASSTGVLAANTSLTNLLGSGTGAATTISIPHGMSGITSNSVAIVTPRNAASAGISYVTTDATNINIIYTVAPANGTNNLSYSVIIK